MSIPHSVFTKCDMSGADLPFVDFSHSNLCCSKLCKAVLTGSNLSGCDLRSTNFQGAVLESTIFCGAMMNQQTIESFGREGLRCSDLNRCDFSGLSINMNLSGCSLRGSNLSDCVLFGSDIRGSNLTDSDLHGTNFDGCVIDEISLKSLNFPKYFSSSVDVDDNANKKIPSSVLLQRPPPGVCGIIVSGGADFSHAFPDLSNINLSKSKLQGCCFSKCVLENVDFCDSNLTGSTFFEAKFNKNTLKTMGSLQSVCLVGSCLQSIDFGGIDLQNVDFRQCDVRGSLFSDSICVCGLKLEGAKLDRISLQSLIECKKKTCSFYQVAGSTVSGGCCCSCCSCRDSSSSSPKFDLRGVVLDNCDLRDLNFEGADLSGSSLCGCVFSSNTNIEGAIFRMATLDNSTFHTLDAHHLRCCNLQGAIFKSVDFFGIDFREIDVSDCGFSGCSFCCSWLCGVLGLGNGSEQRVHFSGARMDRDSVLQLLKTNSDVLKSGCLKGCDFSGAVLADINLSGSDLRNCDFSKADLTKVCFSCCVLDGCQFRASILKSTQFSNSTLKDASFDRESVVSFLEEPNSKLCDIPLCGSDLSKQELSGLDFSAVVLTGCNLENTMFKKCQMKNTDFSESKVTGACFEESVMDTFTISSFSVSFLLFLSFVGLCCYSCFFQLYP